ncbi:UDP-N-acetylmuramate dehydrogenase [Canibacter sp. lx-45]|uniref:UDP-N-acetylmuramate dehydrogenase n=1 Tax=Canibacter zhuwentaonis TaxID=2837491 RepID=UPI001BDCE151|nr:UDP-N-acetylmuramate dehydrogenase [Canibacter zhuwentaonis]MBT1035604.1 UDP-N-acetylmuramate dehydrogenase [Canibacter zhuwentaonis]
MIAEITPTCSLVSEAEIIPARPLVSEAELRNTTSIAQLTTMRVGGAFAGLTVCRTEQELIAGAARNWASDEPWLLLGGGSNTVVSDAGYPGEVVLVRTEGIEPVTDPALPSGSVRVRVAAGHDWDSLVRWSVECGYAGLEVLSGIPGLAGSAPVQNIGAYGGELAQVLHSVRVYERESGQVRELKAAQLGLGYRTSAFKRGYAAVILSVDLILRNHSAQRDPLAMPVVFPQLATVLGVKLGCQLPLRQVREAVLRVRAAKGMVWQLADKNSWSAGSFFVNPIVSQGFARGLPENAPRYPVAAPQRPDLVTTFEELAAGQPLQLHYLTADMLQDEQEAGERVKLSAAWLIENAGVRRGFSLPGSGAAVSELHTLAITNRGSATAADVAQLARYIVQLVQAEFGVVLVPEPNIYGLQV